MFYLVTFDSRHFAISTEGIEVINASKLNEDMTVDIRGKILKVMGNKSDIGNPNARILLGCKDKSENEPYNWLVSSLNGVASEDDLSIFDAKISDKYRIYGMEVYIMLE